MAPPAARRGPVGGRFNNRSSAGSFPYASSNSSFDGYTPSTTPFGSVAGVNHMGGQIGMGMNTNMNMVQMRTVVINLSQLVLPYLPMHPSLPLRVLRHGRTM